MPPINLADYYEAVFNLADHWQGHVDRYSIENEASALPVWPSSPESYFEMIGIANKAIVAASPDAVMLDSGTGSNAYGALLGNHMLKMGQVEEAITFVNEYYAHYSIGRRPIDLSSEAELREFLADPLLQRVLEWMPLLFSNVSYDTIQVHYYGPWDKLATVMHWVRDQQRAVGIDRPIEVWELGYGWQDPDTYDETAHAQDTVKLLATAAGEGSSFVIYWPFVDKLEKRTPGLVTQEGLRPAGVAYGVTNQMLAGSTSAQRLDLSNSEAWAYRFSRNGHDTYVIWSTRPATVSLPIDAARVEVIDIFGNEFTGDPRALSVGISPIFIRSE